MDTAMPPSQPAASSTEDKTVAIVAYLTLIGFIVAIIMHSSKKTQIGAYHLRQALGLFIAGIVLGWIPFLNLLVLPVLFVFWLLGFINAIKGEMKPIPLVGPMFEKWFAGAFG